MRATTFLTLICALFLIPGCASQSGSPVEPEIVVRQMPDNFDLLAFPGPIALRYQVTIGNPSGETINIERLELRSNGPGPYSVPQKSRGISVTVSPGEIVTFDFIVDAVSRGDDRLMREPVTLSGTAYFRSSEGPFSKSFIQIIRGISEDLRGREPQG